ncbi:MAG: ABC transporter ATP-binding protein [Thermoanaerobaculaceae bacterium]
MVEVQDLRFSYGTREAVKGLHFKVEPEEVFGLLGPNGAGKTTTFLLVAGVFSPQNGQVCIGGQPPSISGARSQLGFAPQNLAVYEHLSAEENLRLFAELYGWRGSQLAERVRFCLEAAGLLERKGQKVGTFSQGMKRRLNVVAAFCHDPKVILLDEPTAGVDPQSRAKIFQIVRQMQRQGKAVLFSSHILGEAEAICDRVAIIDHGEMVAQGTVGELVQRYGGPPVISGEMVDNVALPELSGARWEGNRFFLPCPKPGVTLPRLLGLGPKLKTVELRPPSLEEVFLRLTGREMRDA